jgi:hypothetical protein
MGCERDPMAVASIFGFRSNPKAFYDWRLRTAVCRHKRAIMYWPNGDTGHLKAVITRTLTLHTSGKAYTNSWAHAR